MDNLIKESPALIGWAFFMLTLDNLRATPREFILSGSETLVSSLFPKYFGQKKSPRRVIFVLSDGPHATVNFAYHALALGLSLGGGNPARSAALVGGHRSS